MKVILRQDVEKLGKLGEVVTVRRGFARNYLIPQGIAYPEGSGYMRRFEEERSHLEVLNNRRIKSAEDMKTRLEVETLLFKVRTSEEGKMFGSITSAQIVESLHERGLDVDKRRIELSHPLKELGMHQVAIKLHTDVVALVNVNLVREGAEPVPDEDGPEVIQPDEDSTATEEEATEASADDAESTEENAEADKE